MASAAPNQRLADFKPVEAGQFFQVTLQLAGGIAVAAVLIGQAISGRPWGSLSLDGESLFLGAIGAFPLFMVIYASGPFNDFVLRRVAPALGQLGSAKVYGLAILVAVAEELCFRGVLPTVLRDLGPMWAIVASNALFAACYATSVGAWVTMFLFGSYLSGLYSAGDGDNVVRPIIAHAIFLMILLPMLAKSARRRAGNRPAEEQPASESAS